MDDNPEDNHIRLMDIRNQTRDPILQILQDQTTATYQSLTAASTRQLMANFISVCFNPVHVNILEEQVKLADLKLFAFVLHNRVPILFDKAIARQRQLSENHSLVKDIDPDISLDNIEKMCWESSSVNSALPKAALPEFPLSELPSIGHNELFALKYFLDIFTLDSLNAPFLSHYTGILITMGDTLFQVAPFLCYKNYACHMLASLLCASTTITQECTFGYDCNAFLVAYDAMALALGLIPDNKSVFKVNVHPTLPTHEQAVSYFLKLAPILVQMACSNHYVLHTIPGLILEALFEVFFVTFNPQCLHMCSDLLHLGSLKNMPIPAQLGYFLEILNTACNFLSIVNESQHESLESDDELLKMEDSLGCILIDIINILPPSTHVMIKSSDQFTSAVLLFSRANSISKSLLDSMIHCILVISPYATQSFESIFKSTQYATSSSQAILLKYIANALNLLPSHISYSILSPDPLFQFKDITLKRSRKASNGGSESRVPKRLNAKDTDSMEIIAEELEEAQRVSQACFDCNTEKLIKMRGLGNSSKEISSAIFSHLVYHSLNFLGPLYSEKLTTLADVISVLEIGIMILPKECYLQLHQIISCCLDPLFSFILAKQVQVTEPFYSELCSIAILFSFSTTVWKDTVCNITCLDLCVFDKYKLEKLLAASKKKLELFFKKSSLSLEIDNLLCISLSGMVALLSNSEVDYDITFPVLLVIIFYSLQNSSPASLQAHVWRIMPKALTGTFLSYLNTESILLLTDLACQNEFIYDEVKDAFALNLGKLVCSIAYSSTNCTQLPFPSGEVFCPYCDSNYKMLYKKILCLDKVDSLVSLPPKQLEVFPMKSLKFLLSFIKETVCQQSRIGACLSLSRMLVHLPLEYYTQLLKLIPELFLLVIDDNSKIRQILSTAFLKLAPFEGSERKQIFLLKLVEHMFNSIKDDPSELTLDIVLSLACNLAKKAHPIALSFILTRLSQYFYHNDKQIIASIFTKLHSIAASHKIALKTLFSPLWETLAGYILTDFRNQGHFVTNMAAALQVDQSGVLKLACPHLLPMVLIERDMEMLKKLAELIIFDTDRANSEEAQALDLCIEYLQYILAGLLLWDDPECSVSLKFFFGLFKFHPSLKGQFIIKSCIADLTLVLSLEFGKLGNHELSNAKIDSSFDIIAKSYSKNWAAEYDLEPIQHFLIEHFMYIICSFNSILSEYRHPQDYTMQVTALLALDVIIKRLDCCINTYIPQILSAVKSSTHFSFLTHAGIQICKTLMEKVGYNTCKPYVNQILAMFSECYSSLEKENQSSILVLFKLIYQKSFDCNNFTVISLPDLIPEFESLNLEMKKRFSNQDPSVKARQCIENLTNDNFDVCVMAIKDLLSFLLVNKEIVAAWVLNEPISPIIESMISSLSYACEKFNEKESTVLHYNAMLCFGILGAVDPDRLSPKKLDCQTMTSANFFTVESCIQIGSDLIEHHLVHLYFSSMVVKDQYFIAYTIQELMRFCDFNPSNITSDYADIVRPFSQMAWKKLPSLVKDSIRPFMYTKYKTPYPIDVETEHPIFSARLSFKSWLCRWTSYLILQIEGDITKDLFRPCFKVASNYVEVAAFLIPHLILALILQNNTNLTQMILQEMHAVLNVSAQQLSGITHSKSSQLIFSIIVHLSNWCFLVREHMSSNQLAEGSQIQDFKFFDIAAKACQGFVHKFPNLLLAQTAHKTQNYFHAVFYLEAHIYEVKASKELATEKKLNDLYFQLYDLYFQLDNVDGLQGVRSLYLVGDIQQQLQEHKANRNWPAAQVCYEVLANTGLNYKTSQLGIISCMKNMGSLELASNYLAALTAKLSSVNLLDDFPQAEDESTCCLGNWNLIINEPTTSKPSFDQSISNLILSSKYSNSKLFYVHLEDSRQQLLIEFFSNISDSYVQGYNAIVWSQMLDEAETFYQSWNTSQSISDRLGLLNKTEVSWNYRLLSTSPSFKVRESILNFRRALLDVHYNSESKLDEKLVSKLGTMLSCNSIQIAKLARKAGYSQTSYRSLLEHTKHNECAVAKELAKWYWSQGNSWKAIDILIKLLGKTAPALIAERYNNDTTSFSESIAQSQVRLKLVKWMKSINFCSQDVFAQEISKLCKAQPKWEECYFYATQHLFGLLKQRGSNASLFKIVHKDLKLVAEIVIAVHNCLKFSSKYVYQLLPCILTLWLHCNIVFQKHIYLLDKVNTAMFTMVSELPVYMLLPIFSQVVSQLNTDGQHISKVFVTILYRITKKYPHQALWALVETSVSQEQIRSDRYVTLISKLKMFPEIGYIIQEMQSFCDSLRSIANFNLNPSFSIDEEEKRISLFLSQYTKPKFPYIIMPTKSALSFNLASARNSEDLSDFTPFTNGLVTIKRIISGVKVMNSCMSSLRLIFMGSDNNIYRFLIKTKTNQQKDSRLIQIFHSINHMFNQDSEARRRQLHISTYVVVPLNHQCCLVEWVDNLESLHNCNLNSYQSCEPKGLPNEKLTSLMCSQTIQTREQHVHIFENEVLPAYPPVLHNWFLKNFPHPVKWFGAREIFARSLAAMSMVGFVVGLGNRQANNILLAKGTGDVVHFDFSSLFEAGINLDIPELIPFRLTSNMIHALGVTKYEGTFRKSCEITLKVLRANQESIKAQLEISFLDMFADFPSKKNSNFSDNPLFTGRTYFIENIFLNRPYKNLDADHSLNNPDALWALDRISKKLEGKSSSFVPEPPGTDLHPVSVEGQVFQLLQAATDSEALFQMYLEWEPRL